MARYLAVFTVRGWTFLSAGITTVVVAIVLGQTPLVAVGVLLAVLPLLGAATTVLSRVQIGARRTLFPTVVPVGESAHAQIHLSRRSGHALGTLHLSDSLPDALGGARWLGAYTVARKWQVALEYPVRTYRRGVHTIGPLAGSIQDALGMAESKRRFHDTVEFTVTPRVVPLPVTRLVGTSTGSNDERTRASMVGSAEDVTVREYHRGDELRRIHWPSSARTGQLMVRREEQPWLPRALIYLDTQRAAYARGGHGADFEAAVSAAASLVEHLGERRYAITLVTSDGTISRALSDGEQYVDTQPLLRLLAGAEASTESANPAWLASLATGNVICAVTGPRTGDVDPTLAGLLQLGEPNIVVRVGETGGHEQGWHTVAIATVDDLPGAWGTLNAESMS